jgi:Ca2+-binding RTX toxin-like protein
VSFACIPPLAPAVAVDLASGVERLHGLKRFIGIEAIVGTFGDDVLKGDGSSNRFRSFTGDDVIDGRGGHDRARAGQGDDTCIGIEAPVDCEVA